jgi:hypothetical protein
VINGMIKMPAQSRLCAICGRLDYAKKYTTGWKIIYKGLKIL